MQATTKSMLASTFHEGFDMLMSLQSEGITKELRQRGFDHLAKEGFPTTRHEEFKYTSVKSLVDSIFQTRFVNTDTLPDLSQLPFFTDDVHQVIIHNGQVVQMPEVSGFTLKPSKEGINSETGTIADLVYGAFTAYNQAYFQDGFQLHFPKNTTFSKTIVVYNVITGKHTQAVTRNFIEIEQGSKASIVVVNYSTAASYLNNVTEVKVGRNAKLNHVQFQNDHDQSNLINRTAVVQSDGSTFSDSVFTFNGKLIRNDLTVKHTGPVCHTEMNGLYMISGKTHVDNHTAMDHAIANCTSDEMYKGVMSENAVGVFNGKIFVREDAQQTNAFQNNKNILLGDSSTVYTKPQLEIFADDVKCSHGCTIGRFDDSALFYLRARGVSEARAKVLLTQAFANEVVERLEDELLKETVLSTIESKLSHG